MQTPTDPQSLLAIGQQLITNRHHDDHEFTRGLEYLETASRAGLVEAQLVLGHMYAQIPDLNDAARLSAHWYGKAAQQDDMQAQDRLADACLLGRGVEADDTRAFHWMECAAEHGHPHALCSLAYFHDTATGTDYDADVATDAYLLAAAQADPRALFNLGLRYRDGRGAPRHETWALACLSLAAFAGYPLADECAQRLRDTLSEQAHGEADGLQTNLRARLRAFQTHLDQNPSLFENTEQRLQFARDNFNRLNDPAVAFCATERAACGQSEQHSPQQADPAQTLNESPHIFTVDNFLSESECAQLLAAASQDMQAASQAPDRLSGEQTAFTGTLSLFAAPDYDVVMRCVERRIADCFNLPPSHVEPLSVLRYGSGHQYSAHVDYFDTARLEYNQSIGDYSGQRVASFLVYLRAPEQGGETAYLDIGLEVTGRPRMALCHWNLGDDKTPDPKTLHCGKAVASGEKWLARTTIREKNLY